jgi:hypothetical protein
MSLVPPSPFLEQLPFMAQECQCMTRKALPQELGGHSLRNQERSPSGMGFLGSREKCPLELSAGQNPKPGFPQELAGS